MKIKYLSILFLISLSSLAAFADEKNIQTDQQATAVPWKVGDVVTKGLGGCIDDDGLNNCDLYRKFLGVDSQGYYWVQDFYLENNNKRTDPYLVLQEKDVTSHPYFVLDDESIHGGNNTYHPNGNIWRIETLAHGVKQGLYIDHWSNGQKKEEGHYQDGIREGRWIEWYENGSQSAEHTRVAGFAQGTWSHWYRSGELMRQAHYKDENEHGLTQSWYLNGQLMVQGQYENNCPVGIWMQWNEAGELIRKEDRGELVAGEPCRHKLHMPW